MALSTWVATGQEGRASGRVTDAATTEQKNAVGKRIVLADGRAYRYASSDSDITVGFAVGATTNVQEIASGEFGPASGTAPTSKRGGSTLNRIIEHNITTGTHTIAADEYAGGYLVVKDGTGEGYTYRVVSNEANGSSGTATFEILPGLDVALDNTSEGVLVSYPYDNVKSHLLLEMILGVCTVPVTAGTDGTVQYFWIQTWGFCQTLPDSTTLFEGITVQPSQIATGRSGHPSTGNNQLQTIGVAASFTDAGKYGPIWLKVSP